MHKKYFDVVSNIDFTVIDEEVYTVYIRRSNGLKKIVYTSRSPSKAFHIYHGMKVFKQDRKFLMAKFNGAERQLLAQSGTEVKPKHISHKGVKAVSKIRTSPVLAHTAVTLLEEISKVIKQHTNSKGRTLSRNKLIPILYSYFIDCSIEKRNEILTIGEEIHLKHRYLSGGDNDEHAEKLLMSKEFKDEDSELL
jgi:hypothetical protein